MIWRRTRLSRAFSCCCISAMRALRSWLTCFLGMVILGLLRGTAVRRFYVLDGDIPVVRGLRETVPVMDFSVRLWSPGWPLDLFAIIGGLSRGHGDPTFCREPDGTIWRGIRTPQGASTLRLRLVEGSAVEAAAWGPGAGWVLASVPAMLGDLDDPTGFVAHHP